MSQDEARKLIPVGFYREMDGDPDERESAPSIAEALSESPGANEEQVVAYLRNAVCWGAKGGYVDDVLDPSCRLPLLKHLYTDGVYIWRLDLAHYVNKYHLRLPSEFLEHMASRNWQPPAKHEINFPKLD